MTTFSDKQAAWLEGEVNNLNNFFRANFPLTSEQWDLVADIVNKDVKLAKSKGRDVRLVLFDTIEPWDRKANEMQRL